MDAIRAMLRKLRRHQGGATAIEYGLIVALISVAAIGAMSVLGGQSGTGWQGISDKVIDRVLAPVDSSASAYRAAVKKARQMSHLDQATFERRLVDYLARRGFEYEVAREAVGRHWTELTAAE